MRVPPQITTGRTGQPSSEGIFLRDKVRDNPGTDPDHNDWNQYAEDDFTITDDRFDA